MPSRVGALGRSDERIAHARQPGRIERQRRAPRLPCAAPPTAPPSASRLRQSGSAGRRPTACGSSPCGRHGRAASRPRLCECLRTEARIGFSAASVASFHKPEAARRDAADRLHMRWPRCRTSPRPTAPAMLMWVKCQSLASPSSAEYWHIGATMMRLGSVRPRSWIGENRALMGNIRMEGRGSCKL